MINIVLDFLFPRYCHVCGNRLLPQEQTLCVHCNVELPRTFYWNNPYDNDIAKIFWGRIKTERAAAYIFYRSHSGAANMVYAFKYNREPYVAKEMGKMMAKEMGGTFFEGIDCIIPVPLNRKRIRKRGYNQSECLARGVAGVTGIPVINNAVIRNVNTVTQTTLDMTERLENAENIFCLTKKANKLQNCHCLLIDDVITTGATMTSCAKEILRISGVRVSILSFGSATQTY